MLGEKLCNGGGTGGGEDAERHVERGATEVEFVEDGGSGGGGAGEEDGDREGGGADVYTREDERGREPEGLGCANWVH